MMGVLFPFDISSVHSTLSSSGLVHMRSWGSFVVFFCFGGALIFGLHWDGSGIGIWVSVWRHLFCCLLCRIACLLGSLLSLLRGGGKRAMGKRKKAGSARSRCMYRWDEDVSKTAYVCAGGNIHSGNVSSQSVGGIASKTR